MKIGITLPQFAPDVAVLRRAVVAAEAAGVDGIFVFDHLWPIGNPDGDVIHSTPLLGFLAQLTGRVAVGPLVARIGVVPDAVLVNQFDTIHRILGDRLIAGVGTGDALSAAENRAFGLSYPPAGERLAAVAGVLDQLRDRGITTWVGGRSAAVRRVAAAHADALNVWGATPEQVRVEGGDLRAQAASKSVAVTWGGQVLIGHDDAHATELVDRHGLRAGLVHGSVAAVGSHLARLRAERCEWAVCAPLDVSSPDAADRVMAAAAAAAETDAGAGADVH